MSWPTPPAASPTRPVAATVVALLLGLFSMARGGEFDKRNANRFMRLRVACQAVAIALFLIFMMVWHRG